MNGELSCCLIPCQNTAPVLKQCLESIRQQFDEIVIYLDNCTDGSYQICVDFQKQYPNYPFLILEGRETIGVQASRNFLYDWLRPEVEIVCFFDSDDFRVGGKTEFSRLKTALLNSGSSVAALITPAVFYFRDPHHASEVYDEEVPAWASFDVPTPSIWSLLASRSIQTGGVLWRKTHLDLIKKKHGTIWHPERIGLQDVGLILDAIEMGLEFSIYPECHHYYRWGWSRQQITIRDHKKYHRAIINFLTRLYDRCPQEFKKETAASLSAIAAVMKELEEAAADPRQILEDTEPYFS